MQIGISIIFFAHILQLIHADSDSSFAECGVSNLADGGEGNTLHPVAAGNFPWYTIIYHKKSNGGEVFWQRVCGGTLITSQAVVTAAVCLHQKTPEDIKVALGKLKSQWNDTEPNETKRDVKEIHIHEGFVGNMSYLENNIGVLILSSEVPVSSFVCLAFNAESLQASRSLPGYMVGWNIHEKLPDGHEEPPTDKLKYARVTILEHSACAPFHLPLDSYCNGTELIPHGKGNVGSGLTFVSEGHHYLYGIVGIVAVHDSHKAGPYVNVSYHYDWIKNHMT